MCGTGSFNKNAIARGARHLMHCALTQASDAFAFDALCLGHVCCCVRGSRGATHDIATKV
jgi:hypothetical protein